MRLIIKSFPLPFIALLGLSTLLSACEDSLAPGAAPEKALVSSTALKVTLPPATTVTSPAAYGSPNASPTSTPADGIGLPSIPTLANELDANPLATASPEPADSEGLVKGIFTPTVLGYEATSRIDTYKKNHPLLPNERVFYERDKHLVIYKLRPAIIDDILNLVQIRSGTMKIYYRYEAVVERLKEFITGESLSAYERARADERTNSIDYELTPDHLEKLKAFVANIDRAPYTVVVEVKLLSVSKDDQYKIGSVFSQSSVNSNGNNSHAALIDLLGDDPLSSFKTSYKSGSELIEYTIGSLESKGRAYRHLLPVIQTLENYRNPDPNKPCGGPANPPCDPATKPIVLAKTVNTSVTTITQNGPVNTNVAVGLGVVINRIQVVENDSFRDRLAELQRKFDVWMSIPKNRDMLARVQKAYQRGQFDTVPLSEIDSVLKQTADFREQRRQILNSLQILVDASLKDGGIIQLVQTSSSVTPEYREVQYDFRMLLDNKVPAFLGATNSNEIKTGQKNTSILSKIPILGKLFRQELKENNLDSVVAFLTVSVKDDQTDANMAARYTGPDQRQAVPRSLGGFADDSVNEIALRTSLRSSLYWMYDDKLGGIFYRALSKIPKQSQFAIQLFATMFNQHIFRPIRDSGLTAEVDWMNYPLIVEKLDHLNVYDARARIEDPSQPKHRHPFVRAMLRLQREIQAFTQVSLSLSEILALVRDQGYLGRGADPSRPDERLLFYMSYLIAKETGERDVFQNRDELNLFERKYLPRFRGQDGVKRSEEFNRQIIKNRSH